VPGPFETRVAYLRTRLTAVQSALTHVCTADPGVGQAIAPTVKAGIARAQRDAGSLAGQPSPRSWSELAKLDATVEQLASLVLTYLGGAAARRDGVDGGLCTAADRLVSSVIRLGGPGWAGATLPGDSELVDGNDGVIRVRFPDDGVWSLPLVLHELGHVVGPALTRRKRLDVDRTTEVRPLRRHLDRLDRTQPRLWHHAQELFADVYATYVGGPAFMAASVVQRFDPSSAGRDTKTHPSPNRRVALMIDVLGEMARLGTEGTTYVSRDLRVLWCDLAGLGDAKLVVTESDRRFGRFSLLLLDEVVPQARFTDLKPAETLALGLQKDLAPAGDVAPVDVLNAAWIVRLNDPARDPVALSDQALAALGKI
jgi:hypothetical protein